jgi:hypothetical protein
VRPDRPIANASRNATLGSVNFPNFSIVGEERDGLALSWWIRKERYIGQSALCGGGLAEIADAER